MGERVEAVAIGRIYDIFDPGSRALAVPLSREEAMGRPELEREYDGCFASETPPHAIYAWTASWVLFVSGYDGSSRLSWVPRHPGRCTPEVEDPAGRRRL